MVQTSICAPSNPVTNVTHWPFPGWGTHFQWPCDQEALGEPPAQLCGAPHLPWLRAAARRVLFGASPGETSISEGNPDGARNARLRERYRRARALGTTGPAPGRARTRARRGHPPTRTRTGAAGKALRAETAVRSSESTVKIQSCHVFRRG